MNILLIAGHGAGDTGACGCGYEEADLTREVVSMLADKLQDYANIDIYPMDHSAYHDLSVGDLQVNWTDYDYVLEIHFNAGGGEGTEIYVTRIEEGTDTEETIMSHLEDYFTVRGVKRMNFNVIYSAKKAGVSSALLEVCFIDNEDDMNTYENNKDEVVQAIAEGIKEGFDLYEEIDGGDIEPSDDLEIPYRYQNGSTFEDVFSDTESTNKIGYLNKYENVPCLGVYKNRAIVLYKVDNSENYKIGFCKWLGGVSK